MFGVEIVFGLFADGGASPDHGGDERGAFGAPVLGPLGLIDHLETRLGLGGQHSSQVLRIAAFQAALEELTGNFFWTRSLARDPWATARTLLAWRDQLIDLGWDAEAAWSGPRLKDLASVSLAAANMPDGSADRMRAILDQLGDTPVRIDRLRLIDRRDHLPSPLRRLVGQLEQLGTAIEQIQFNPSADLSSALGRLQRWMQSGGAIEGTADGSVVLARATNGPLAADLLGQWFADRGNGDVALIAQQADTDLLDHGLKAAAQPRAGRSVRSPHRGDLQLLLLAFKVAWAPFDAQALMELLVFPSSPIPRRAAGPLAGALEQAPGLGGELWLSTWADILDKERARADANGEPRPIAEQRIERWRAWAEPALVSPIDGLTIGDATAICVRVEEWARQRAAATNDPLLHAAARFAADVRLALIALKRDRLPRLLIERIIDQALDVGENNPHADAEAAPWRSIAHPGSLWASTPSVLWWNFSPSDEGRDRSPWTIAEREELTQADCPADDLSLAGLAASQAWERAVLCAQGELIFVSFGLASDLEESLHPLAHRLRAGLAALADHRSLDEAFARPEYHLGQTRLGREPVASSPLCEPRHSWQAPVGFGERRDRHRQSASSLESLLSCQLMWALRYVARLRPGRFRSIPDANRLLGNLAHAIAREIFPPGAPPSPDEAAAQTRALLDARIDELAAPIRHPEFADELAFARRRLPEAMASLAETLIANNLMVEGTEMQVSAECEEALALTGSVDLVARDRNGNAVIVDLKWTRSDKSRIKELEEGSAVQLATYGAMVAPSAPYRAGYFLLNQRQFATLQGSGLIGRDVTGARSFPETWDTIRAAWRSWRTGADAGQLVAAGVAGAEEQFPADLALRREVRCDRCDYATLCRQRGRA